MRPSRLTIEGINSFIEPQTIDFDAAGADNLFCISGSTGSGKTTIIDSIILALYPKHGERGNLDEYVNLRCEKAKISFRFELGGDIYDTERVITRKKTGKNTYVLKKNGTPIAEGDEAFALVGEMIGLDVKEFTNVVVLQQGEFSRFLKAKKAERVTLITKLFDLGRFDGAFTAFSAKNRELGSICDGLSVAIEHLPDVSDESIKEAETSLKLAEEKQNELDKLSAELKKRSDEAKQNREAFDKLKKKKDDLTAVEKKIQDHAESMSRGEKIGKELELAESELKKREAERDGLVERRTEINSLIEKDTALKKEERAILDEEAELNKRKADLGLDEKNLENAKNIYESRKTEFETALKADAIKGIFSAEPNAETATRAEEGAKHDLETALRLRAEADKASETALKAHAEKEKATELCLKIESMHKELLDRAQLADKTANAARENYDKAIKADALGTVMMGLREGDDCPVCGGKITRLESHSGINAEEAKLTMESAEKEAKRLADELNKSQSTVAMYKEQYVSADKNYIEKANLAREAEEKAKQFDPIKLQGKVTALSALSKTIFARDEAEKSLTALTEKLGRQADIITEKEKAIAVKREKYNNDQNTVKTGLGENPEAELIKITATLEKLKSDRIKLDEEKRKYSEGMNTMRKIAIQNDSLKASLLTAIDEIKNAVFTSDEDLNKLATEAQEKAKEALETRDFVSRTREKLNRAKTDLAQKNEFTKELKATERERKKYAELEKLFKGRAFSEFVAAEYIKDFTASASTILGELTGGKYSLWYDEGVGEFYVLDFLSGNERRGVNTLSGGETFLASLSLAIAISEMLSKDKNYEFFFIDEGFGTLSPDALDAVTEALDALSRKTMVGVITHRGELIERIQSVIKVEPSDGETGSKIIFG